MLTFLSLLLVFLCTLLYLPPLSWWQIVIAQFAIILSHLVFIGLILKAKTQLKYFLVFAFAAIISTFYFFNCTSSPDNTLAAGESGITVAHASADINISESPAGVSINSMLFNLVEEPTLNLGQALGRVAISRYRKSDGVSFTIAYVESENLFSDLGWWKNKILLRRLGAKLRQFKEPILVIFNLPLPAGSSLLDQFMFQARLDLKASINPWKSLLGIKAPLILGREIRFKSDTERDGKNNLRFIVNL